MGTLRRAVPAALVGSPVLPLPVELVAGGDGRPELLLSTGLGGSGRSGMLWGKLEMLGVRLWADVEAELAVLELGAPFPM